MCTLMVTRGRFLLSLEYEKPEQVVLSTARGQKKTAAKMQGPIMLKQVVESKSCELSGTSVLSLPLSCPTRFSCYRLFRTKKCATRVSCFSPATQNHKSSFFSTQSHLSSSAICERPDFTAYASSPASVVLGLHLTNLVVEGAGIKTQGCSVALASI